VNSFEVAEKKILFALLTQYHIHSSAVNDLDALNTKYNIKLPSEWLYSSVTTWEEFGWVNVSRTLDGKVSAAIRRDQYGKALNEILSWLGAETLSIDGKKEEIFSDISPPDDIPMQSGWKWYTLRDDGKEFLETVPLADEIPASDRVVTLDHNQPDYKKIKAELEDVKETLRGLNDTTVSQEERSRLSAGIDSAQVLWNSLQLKVIQIKVGIIMVLEDIGKIVGKTAKGVSVALIVDGIKSYIKDRTGIEF